MSGTPGVYHKHMTQRVAADPHWQVNCTAYTGAMLINDSVLGGLEGINGRLVRALSSEPTPDPASPGLNVIQIDAVCKRLRVPFYDKTGESWTKLKNYVGREGASRCILAVYYDVMQEKAPGLVCQRTGSFSHSILVINVNNGVVHASDPLCAVTKDYPEAVIRAAAIKQADGGLFFGISRTVPKQCG